MRKSSMMAALGAVAALAGGVAMVSGGPGPESARAIEASPAAVQQIEKQRAERAAQQMASRESAIEADRRRWRGWRYRKDGQPRKAGDRAHKRMKQARRAGR
jgi:hypothetical protein